jgi:hypothetical protein
MCADDTSQEYRIKPIEIFGEQWDGVYITSQDQAYVGRVCTVYTGVSSVLCVEPVVGDDGSFCEAPENWRALVVEHLG